MLASISLGEEGVDCIITTTNRFGTWHLHGMRRFGHRTCLRSSCMRQQMRCSQSPKLRPGFRRFEFTHKAPARRSARQAAASATTGTRLAIGICKACTDPAAAFVHGTAAGRWARKRAAIKPPNLRLKALAIRVNARSYWQGQRFEHGCCNVFLQELAHAFRVLEILHNLLRQIFRVLEILLHFRKLYSIVTKARSLVLDLLRQSMQLHEG